ncbi:DUF5626 family protein [Lapidilactobacillus mulanensis]|uniref:DUF5626 family protein n=2 Tax=Lapidilactobacillus mulanensis TaxID=2485999 RepID=A0ABW4DQ65_9LACO
MNTIILDEEIGSMKKILSVMILCLAFICVSARNDSAATIVESVPSLDYNLTTGGTQSTEGNDEEGHLIEITVSEVPSFLRMANKTYTVSKKGLGWHVSYEIGVKSNKITTVSGLSAVATTGSFTSSKLQKISSTKASWTAVRKIGILSNHVFCTVIISSGSMRIS